MASAPPRTLFDEVTDFLSSGPTVEEIIAYKPSGTLEHRLEELLDKNKRGDLATNEREELENFLQLNHLLKMLKLKAQLRQQEQA